MMMKMKWCLLCLSFLLMSTMFAAHESDAVFASKKKSLYQLAVATVFRNEAAYLKEWIEFHRLVGVEHFYLYSNLSTDDYQAVLKPYLQAGIVDLFEWPYESQDGKTWNAIQCSAFCHALKKAKKQTKWLAFLDTDEFLFPVQEDNLVHFLKNYEDCAGICVNWQMYGTSGVAKVLPHELQIERLLLKAPSDYIENTYVKSIVQPRFVETVKDPHIVRYKSSYFQVNADRLRFSNSTSPYITIDKIRINHYWSRDEWFFYNVKCARRQKWQEGFDGQLNRLSALNQVFDDSILKYVPLLKHKMGK